jgi:hypothetical protein
MRTPESLLAYEASRKPIVADLVNRCEILTDDEINQAEVLPWIKKLLLEKREMSRYRSHLSKFESEMVIKTSIVPDPAGTIYYWNGDDEWIQLDGPTMLMIRYGDLIWCPDSGGAWIDTIFVSRPMFLNRSVFVQRSSKLEYIVMRKEKLSKNCGSAPIIDLTGADAGGASGNYTMPSALSNLGVRFTR